MPDERGRVTARAANERFTWSANLRHAAGVNQSTGPGTALLGVADGHGAIGAGHFDALATVTGVVVGQTEPGFPAAGVLRPGDVLTAVDGTPVTSITAAGELIDGRTPGQPVTLTIRRPVLPGGGQAPGPVRSVISRTGRAPAMMTVGVTDMLQPADSSPVAVQAQSPRREPASAPPVTAAADRHPVQAPFKDSRWKA